MSDERVTTAVDRRIGGRVRMRRLEIGMSQVSLAERLGITFQQVQKYENGLNRIAASRLLAIAGVLGVGVDRLYGAGPRERGDRGEHSADHLATSPKCTELMRMFVAIKSQRVRRRIVDVVQAMTEEANRAGNTHP